MAGELTDPVALAVALGGGDVFVADAKAGDVKRYAQDGAFLGVLGEGDRLAEPRALSIDREGHVYVLDVAQHEVQRYTVDGAYDTCRSFRTSDGGGDAGARWRGRRLGGYAAPFWRRRSAHSRDSAGGSLGPTFRFEVKQGEAVEGVLDMGVDDVGRLCVARRGGHVARRFAADGSLETTIEVYATVRGLDMAVA